MKTNENPVTMQGAVCPIPLQQKETIVMGHGSGGKMTHDLILEIFLKVFNNPILSMGNDAGSLPPLHGKFAVSTDAHVVKPIFFPGGDIGKLAICGTVNDVSMLGAKPLYITAGFILEEGLDISFLGTIVDSMKIASEEAGVIVVAGDTKVVERGKADGIYITTAGIGEIYPGAENVGGQYAKTGDKIIISGTLGDHGISVLSARGDLGFETDVISDVAPLNNLIEKILLASTNIHVLRDPTRGGLATSLNEIATQSNIGMVLNENTIPIKPAVHSACEMLGFDPLYIANEGKVIVIVAPKDAQTVLSVMRSHQYGKDASIIGEVIETPRQRVLMKTAIGSHRVVDMLAGEMLPRIC